MMLINQVCKECKLTKKAIEYYEEQRLIHPQVLENGYRDFSDGEIERLQKIATLRRLGFSVAEIQMVLDNDSRAALCSISDQKELEMEMRTAKQELVQKLAQNQDWESIRLQLDVLEQKQTIAQKLRNVFPGSYGKYVSLHFAMYLNEPMITEEQQEAFETMVSFLDRVELKIPVELLEYLDEITQNFDVGFVAGISEHMDKAIQDPGKYIAENQETLEQYMAFKQSDEYKKSPACRLQELLAAFHQESGYDDILIPAMKRASPSYREYHKALEKANEVLIEKYPNGLIRRESSKPSGG